MNKKIIKVNKTLATHFGVPKRAVKLPNSVDMIIATILSQNTNDNNSYNAFQNLKNRFDSWSGLLNVNVRTIEKEIRVAGLGEKKSTAIKEFVKDLHKGKNKISLNHIKKMEDAEAITELTKYNGIGIKTASCVLLFAEGRNICPVDTHVHRTVNRIGIVDQKTPDKTFFALNEDFPTKIAHQFHTNLIRLGREICKPKNPSCGICPISSICEFPDKDLSNRKRVDEKNFMLLDSV